MEHKGFATKVLSTDERLGVVEAIVNVLGVVDLQGDVAMPGCFRRTIQEKGAGKVLVLDQHDASSTANVIGKCLSIAEVGRNALPAKLLADYPEATGGLWTQTRMFLEQPKAAAIFAAIVGGAPVSWSIGFNIRSSQPAMVQGRPVRQLLEIELYEYSAVCFAANQAAMTVSAKCQACPNKTRGHCRACAGEQERRDALAMIELEEAELGCVVAAELADVRRKAAHLQRNRSAIQECNRGIAECRRLLVESVLSQPNGREVLQVCQLEAELMVMGG